MALVAASPDTRWLRRAAAAFLIFVQIGGAAYLAVVVWLLSVWSIDDGLAFRLPPGGWYWIGLQRLAFAVVVAVGAAITSYGLDLVLVRCLVPEYRRTTRYVSIALGGVVALAGFIGCIEFVVRKPYF